MKIEIVITIKRMLENADLRSIADGISFIMIVATSSESFETP